MRGHQTSDRKLKLFWRFVVGGGLLWSFIVGGSLIWNLHLLDRQVAELARREALANFNKDQAFRLWGTKHGGIYAPITKETPPSPHLAHIPERDIETPSGRKLTLMNPAYMVRQLMDDYAELYGIRGKITGFVLLRPGNAPDAWEKMALGKLQDGAKEVSQVAEIDGTPYHRMMRAMYMKPGCEKCHGHLGFKEGDFRGGVGVSIPIQPYINHRNESAILFSLSHGGLWLLGLVGLGFGGHQVHQRNTAREQAEDGLVQLNAELEERVEDRTKELESAHRKLLQQEKLATLGQLTATVTHELRNPLGTMRSSVYLLRQKDGGDDPKSTAAIERIERNVVRCDRIIDELLDFTRIHPAVFQHLLLDAWLGDLLDEQLDVDGVEVVRDFGADDVRVHIDPERLRRAVINLYDNAIQAMTDMEGVGRIATHRLNVRTRCRENNAEIIFSDTGVGIAEDVLARMFEPMYSTKGFGVGLGLPVVKKIAEEHHGSVDIINNDDGGVQATFALPLRLPSIEIGLET